MIPKGADTVAFDQNAYTNQYKRDNYDRVGLLLPKGTSKQLKKYAQSQGKSVNALVIEALESTYGFDLVRKP